MSEKINDGGPAFPGKLASNYTAGISMRDWFAGRALAGMNASLASADAWPTEIGCRLMATSAYQQADAMISARSRGTEQTEKGDGE
jgi:hypothetical protein